MLFINYFSLQMIKPKDVPFPIGYGPATYKAHGQDSAFKGGE